MGLESWSKRIYVLCFKKWSCQDILISPIAYCLYAYGREVPHGLNLIGRFEKKGSGKIGNILRCVFILSYSWFATTRQGGHVGGHYNIIFSRRIYIKIEFCSQKRKMLLFLTPNMVALTSRANQQYQAASVAIFCVTNFKLSLWRTALFRSVANLSLVTSSNILALTQTSLSFSSELVRGVHTRAIHHTRGHFRVSRVLVNGPKNVRLLVV